MATLTGQSIASSYEQLLHVDADGGGNSTTHVSVKDGDNGTTFALTLATDAVMITSTNRLEFGDDGTYINQSGDGILNITSDTEVEINATAVDLNGTLDVSGNAQLSGTVTVGADGSGTDVIFYSGTAGDNFTWDASEECLIITGTDAAQALKVADGDLVVVDKIYLYDNDGDEHISADNAGVLSIAAGAEIDLTATAMDINGTVDISGATAITSTLVMSDMISFPNHSQAQILMASTGSQHGVISASPGGTANLWGLGYSDGSSNASGVINLTWGLTDVTISRGDLIMGTSGKGISFAATADSGGTMTSETLDDYEEGTWDGQLADGSGNNMVMNASLDTGYYTKVGNLVTVTGNFYTTSLGSASGAIRITGLPFTVANAQAAYSSSAARANNLDIDPIYPVCYYGAINDTYIALEVIDVTTGVSEMQASEWTADGGIMVGFSYRAA